MNLSPMALWAVLLVTILVIVSRIMAQDMVQLHEPPDRDKQEWEKGRN